MYASIIQNFPKIKEYEKLFNADIDLFIEKTVKKHNNAKWVKLWLVEKISQKLNITDADTKYFYIQNIVDHKIDMILNPRFQKRFY